jgi:hypothetical protein
VVQQIDRENAAAVMVRRDATISGVGAGVVGVQ